MAHGWQAQAMRWLQLQEMVVLIAKLHAARSHRSMVARGRTNSPRAAIGDFAMCVSDRAPPVRNRLNTSYIKG
jgi:hypothetical protein